MRCVERRGYARRSLSQPPHIEVRLLGLVEADLDGRAVALGGVKQRALLAMLALHANVPVSADRLMEGLWGDELPASAPKMVQLYVSQLRKLLDGAEARIVTLGRGYELRLAANAVDAVRFERLVDEAARSDARASQLAGEALALWRGPPLDDVAAEPFAAAEIRRLQELWLHAREMVIGGALAAGEHDAVLTELEDLVAAHPLREHLHAQRMLALYRCGRQAEALEAYRHARELLVDEIGVEPGAELRRLHEQILDQDPALDVHASKHVGVGAPRRRRFADRLAPHGRPLVIGGALLLTTAIAVIVVELTRSRPAPGPMALGPDSVAMIDPSTGRVKAQIRVGSRPVAVAASAGAVWVANADDGTVSRVDENAERVVKTIGIGDPLSDVEAGGGVVWVAGGTSGRLTTIDPRQNAVSRTFGLQGDNELLPKATLAVAVGARGVWTTSGPDRVLRFDPATERWAGVRVATGPFALAAGRDSVWAGSFRRITRVESATNRVTATIPVSTGTPVAMAVGAGAVWVAGGEANAVWRIDPYSATVIATIAVGRIASGVAIAGGSVWVTNYADGTVSRIDARSNRVVDTIAVGDGPVDIAAGGRGVWVAVQRRDLT